jgi:DNA-binding MarR family transcriptional regulator
MESDLQLMELFGAINRKMWKFMAPAIKDMELSMTELMVLHRLAKSEQCRVTELAAQIGVPTSTLTGIADRLEKEGFIVREHDREDRRSVIMKVTPKVKLILDGKKQMIGGIMNRMLKSMPADRKKRLMEDLRFILESMDKTDEDGK